MIYFTSDLHFFHTNILKYDNRPFSNVEEMNKALIDNWNSIIKKDDIVYILGDFGYIQIHEGIEILKQLKGKKILILGNHDNHTVNNYYKMGFDLVLQEAVIKCGQKTFKLAHYPYKYSKLKMWWIRITTGKKYTKINKYSPVKGNEDFLLHGHVHSGFEKINLKKKQIHVGCYAWKYAPVSVTQIHDLIDLTLNL